MGEILTVGSRGAAFTREIVCTYKANIEQNSRREQATHLIHFFG
jgi:hypothetical protein